MGLLGNKRLKELEREISQDRKRIRELEELCEEKDSFFSELMANSLKHGSSLAGKHMSDRKKYLRGK